MFKRILGFTALLLFWAATLAQEAVISPQAIVVNPRPAFDVDVWVDKDPTGDGAPVYQVGEEIRISVRVGESAYVYLFNVRSDGQIQQILPNRFDEAGRDNFLRAGETRTFPPRGAGYVFNVAPPRGLDKVIALASKRELSTRELVDFQRDPDFAVGRMDEEQFARTLAIIVRPVPQHEWVTDTALFFVGERPARPRFGTLQIRSTPSDAEAFVDGQFVGYTPVSFGTTPGRHEVRIEREGYDTYRTTVNVVAGETARVSANLAPIRRTGVVRFDSSPRGASVTVDGRSLGTTPTGSMTFDEGTYQARFRLSGYDDYVVNFTVRRDSTQTVHGDLRPRAGRLELFGNVGGAQVFIDGEPYGRLASGTGQLSVSDLTPGTYELTVIASGYSTVVREFRIRGGETTELTIRQTRR